MPPPPQPTRGVVQAVLPGGGHRVEQAVAVVKAPALQRSPHLGEGLEAQEVEEDLRYNMRYRQRCGTLSSPNEAVHRTRAVRRGRQRAAVAGASAGRRGGTLECRQLAGPRPAWAGEHCRPLNRATSSPPPPPPPRLPGPSPCPPRSSESRSGREASRRRGGPPAGSQTGRRRTPSAAG